MLYLVTMGLPAVENSKRPQMTAHPELIQWCMQYVTTNDKMYIVSLHILAVVVTAPAGLD